MVKHLITAVCLIAACAVPAQAQSLQRLTVLSFDLSSDTARPQLEVPFHLIVRLHVRERVASIGNIVLPILAELDLQGDSITVRTAADGTYYTESIAVVAHHSGDIAIAPVTLQAIDARDGKPKQYATNGLTLHVIGGSLEPFAQSRSIAQSLAASFLGFVAVGIRVLMWIAGIALAVGVVVLVLRRRPVAATAPPLPEAPAPQPLPPRSRRDALQDALTVLRAERSRAAAVRVRGAVWRMVGANDGETLGDVLKRPEARGGGVLRDLLIALERAAFTYDLDLPAAVDDACRVLERSLA